MRNIREAVVGLGLLLLCAFLAVHWQGLPDQVPTHFDLAGRPDGFGPRTTLLVLPGVAILLYIVLTAVARHPSLFNFPVTVTDANRQRLQRLGVDMIGWLKVEVVWTFVWLMIAAILTAEGRAEGLSFAFTPISMGTIALTITIYWYRMTRSGR